MALTDKLSAIGIAIREKTGKSDLITLDDMPNEIRGISGGGGEDLPAEALIISGDCMYRFFSDSWSWYIKNYGNQIRTENITGTNSMFQSCHSLTNIPFAMNFSPTQPIDAQLMFNDCSNLTELPEMNYFTPYTLNYMFAQCLNLREIPSELYSNWNFSFIQDSEGDTSLGSAYNLFEGCRSLRTVPMDLLRNIYNPWIDGWACVFCNGFYNCSTLDEIIDMPVPDQTEWWDDVLSNFASCCSRLKNLTFETNADDSPKTVRWCNQNFNLQEYVGYCAFYNTAYILNYNSGITADKEVNDDATYQALKDDPDWFASDVAYSRYNHDSAVATINSLPDTSVFVEESGCPNNITFNGAAGSATDGGAISNLTDEEIAVAAAKGWTVALA